MNADTSYDSTDASENAPDDSEAPSEDSGEQTTLVPNSMLTDPKPGDKVTMEIVHCYDDECEVRVVAKAKEKPSRNAAEAFDARFSPDEAA
jgi:hypothetical protein